MSNDDFFCKECGIKLRKHFLFRKLVGFTFKDGILCPVCAEKRVPGITGKNEPMF
jgi:hypothetical protein